MEWQMFLKLPCHSVPLSEISRFRKRTEVILEWGPLIVHSDLLRDVCEGQLKYPVDDWQLAAALVAFYVRIDTPKPISG